MDPCLLKTLFFLIIGFLALTACQTVTTKINKTTEQEKKEYIKKIKGNINFIFLFLAFIFLVIAFINPKFTMKKDISNYIFVVDITQSMLTQDALLNGEKVSRLKYAKDISQKVLEQLPCKTKVSIGMFAGVSVAATYTPIEVCENFSAINETNINTKYID